MSFTKENMDELDKVLTSGVKKVKYSDREIEYASVEEVQKSRQIVSQELNRSAITGGTPEFCKGV